MLCPYQQNICYLKGGFCTLDYPDSAIIYRVASHPQEFIPRPAFQASGNHRVELVRPDDLHGVPVYLAMFFLVPAVTAHLEFLLPPPPSYHICLMFFVHWIIDRGFHLIVNLGCFQDLIHVNCQEAHD